MEEADFYILLKREYFWCRKHSFSNNGRRLRQSARRNISSDAGPRLSEFDNVTTLSLVMIYEEIQRCFGNNDHVKVPWSYSPLSFAMTNEFKEMKRFFCVFKVVSKSRVWTAKLILFFFPFIDSLVKRSLWCCKREFPVTVTPGVWNSQMNCYFISLSGFILHC